MLARQREQLAADLAWTQSRRAHLSLAETQLDAAVAAIADRTSASSTTTASNPETTS